LLPAQEAQPLNNLWPVVLALLAVPLLKQRISPAALGALGISFAGVLVISTHGHVLTFRISQPLGCALAIGSSGIWALFWLLNARDPRDPVVRMFSNFLFGFIYICAAYRMLPHQGRFTLTTTFESIYIGLFEMGITFLLWGRAVELSQGAAAIVNLAYLSPFVSLIFIHFVAGEIIRPASVVGLVLIITGILLQAALHARQAPCPPGKQEGLLNDTSGDRGRQ
jgi:drug/metabolite transporter (DMT)-like permease